MSLIWKRGIECSVAGLTISEPRMSISISRDGANSPARCAARIFNIAPEKETRIGERQGQLVVKAGYGDTLAQVFAGPITRVSRERNNDATARVVVVRAGSEDIDPNKPGGGTVSRGYDGPRSVKAIIRDIASDMGLRTGPLDAIPDMEISWSYSGQASAALSDILARIPGATSYIADGELRITVSGESDSDSNRIHLSPRTGLLGVPTVTDEGNEDRSLGAQCRAFLDPRIKMGTVIDLDSDALSGQYKVVSMQVSLDNWDGPFEQWLDLSPV